MSMVMCTQILVRLCQFILKIISGNEILTSIKGHNSDKTFRKMTDNNPKLDPLMLMCIQNLVRFCPFVLKIISGNEILTSIKGRNSVKILQKMTGIKSQARSCQFQCAYKFWSDSVKILSGNNILTSIKSCNCQNFARNDDQQSQARSCQC